MRERNRFNWVLFTFAGIAALIFTCTRNEPTSFVPFGATNPVAQAAPGHSSAKPKHNLTGLQVFNQTLVRVQDQYVEPSRIDPKEMLYAAVDSVQFNVPEVLIEPDKSHDAIKVVVNDKKAVFSTSEVNSTWRLAGQLKQIFRFIEANMNPGADLAKVEYAAVNGMLGTLDPHSVLLDPEMAREMDVSTSGKFGGLGIVIGMRKRKLTVLRPMKGTPAYEAGIEANDHIVKIDDEVTENLTLNESVERMRGDPGSSVVIWVQRGKSKKSKRFNITRAIIRVQSVESKLLSKNVGYIKIKQFAGNTGREVRQAMNDLRKQGAKGWVLDLRWNPGGLLEQAIQVSDLFVDAGTIVTTIGGGEREARSAVRRNSDTTSPIAVLVNGSSASASEIVAGALKQLNRALIVGSTTFGKGSVQILYDNKDGSKLKLTIAQYLTPGNRSIQSLGITPDIELQRMYVPTQNKKPSDILRMLPPSRSYREKDLKAHLDSKYAKNGDKPALVLPFLYEPPKGTKPPGTEELDEDGLPVEEEPLEDEFVEDFEIRLGRDLVAGAGDPEAQKMLQKSRRVIATTREAQVDKLAKALKVLGVDWSEAKAPPKPSLSASFQIAGGGRELNAGETVKIIGTVKNSGKVPANRVLARLKSEDRIFDETEFAFGKILPGKTKTWTSFIKVPKAALDRLDYLNFKVKDQSGTMISAPPIQVTVNSSKRPAFSYSHQLIDDGNKDGLVQPGEKYRLRVTVRNTGAGEASETTAILRNASGTDVKVRKARFELDSLKPGEEKTVEFAFDSAPKLREKELIVEMTVYDSSLRESVGEKLKYPVQTASAGPESAKGIISVSQQSALLYEGASTGSATLGLAKRGAGFRVTGKIGDWYQIQLAKKRPAFVHKSSVRKGGRPNSKYSPIWQVTPPKLELALSKMETDAATYKLKGTVTDDTRVEDVYIFVSNRDADVENRKVFYSSNRAGKERSKLPFETDIPLWPGSNLVTIIARENNEVRSSKTLYLFRNKQKVASPARASK